MCDCKKSYGWAQSYSSCWADTILMSLLIPPITKHYFIRFLKKRNLHLVDFFPCTQFISHYEKEYLIKKIWNKSVSIREGNYTYCRLEELLKYININNIMIERYFLEYYKPLGNMFCITSKYVTVMPVTIKNFTIQSILLFLNKHVTSIIRCEDDNFYYFDNERAAIKKKLKLMKIKIKDNSFTLDQKALLSILTKDYENVLFYIYLYAKNIRKIK